MKRLKYPWSHVRIYYLGHGRWVARVERLYDDRNPDGFYDVIYEDYGMCKWIVTLRFNRWARREAKRIQQEERP